MSKAKPMTFADRMANYVMQRYPARDYPNLTPKQLRRLKRKQRRLATNA
jgi:hypothetical protein